MLTEKINCPQRNSSIELYRIIATLAVLVIHFNVWFVGDWPLGSYDIDNPTLFRTSQMTITAATIVCVNMFVVISGYFGIRLKLSSVLKLCIYLALIYVPLYVAKCVSEHDFSIMSLIDRFCVISNAGYFIQCYFMLMILSPLINAFIEKYGKDSLKWVIAFWGLEFWFGCIMDVEELGYRNGHSVIHFVLMYMIARCIKLYEDDIKKVNLWWWVLGYIIATLFVVMTYIVGVKWCWDFSNPALVISAICSFLPFLYKTYYNRFINWVASGTLAVYILHVTVRIRSILTTVDTHLIETNSYPIYLIKVLGVVLIVFIVSVLYGIVCNRISNHLTKGIDAKTKAIFDFK
ncbi:MAG: hypothetical protein J5965_09935 [Aeriscardovia sp.]|nr:hypothetical protein [Aeriscardovia sp.]